MVKNITLKGLLRLLYVSYHGNVLYFVKRLKLNFLSIMR